MPHDTLSVPEADVARVRAAMPAPRVAFVLGSGLSGLAEVTPDAVRVPYAELEGFPRVPNVAGHAGRLVCATLAAMVIIYRHRGNIRRLTRGEEPRLGEKKA